MRKCNWNLDTILLKYDYIKRKYEKEKDPEKRDLYLSDLTLLRDYMQEQIITPVNPRIIDLYHCEKEGLKEIEYLWSYFKDFEDILTDEKEVINPKFSNASLKEKDLLNITHDFYKSINPFIYGNFMKSFYQRYNHVVYSPVSDTSNCQGYNLFLPSINESFLEIYRDYSINDLMVTIHEYGHVIANNVNYLNNSYPNDYYSEIFPLFFELIASDYIGRIVDAKYKQSIKQKEHVYEIRYCKGINNKVKLIDAEHLLEKGYRSNKDIKTIGKDLFNISNSTINNIFDIKECFKDKYVISYLLAVELYKLYLEDKEKTIFLIKKLMLLQVKSELEFFEEIKRLGIIPNQHILEYHRSLTK